MAKNEEECCFDCGKPDDADKSLYSMAMIKFDSAFVTFNYCKECFQQMAGKKYIDMMENYMNHMNSTDIKFPGVHYDAAPMPSSSIISRTTFYCPPPEKKFKFKNIFVHPNGVPRTVTAVLGLMLVLGIYFFAMYKIME